MNAVMGGAEARRGRVITTLHLKKKFYYDCCYFAALGLCCCWVSLVAVSRGCPFGAMHGLLITAASLVAEHEAQ